MFVSLPIDLIQAGPENLESRLPTKAGTITLANSISLFMVEYPYQS